MADGLNTLQIYLTIHQQQIFTETMTDPIFDMEEAKLLLQFIHLFSVYGMMILFLSTGLKDKGLFLSTGLKDKGSKSNCGDYLGISFSKVLPNRLIKCIYPWVIPDSHDGFRM